MSENNAPLLDYLEGQRLKESGMLRAAESCPDWLGRARAVARHLAMQDGSTNIELVYQKVGLPDSPSAAGSVFRDNDWVCIGRTPSTRASRHGNDIRWWSLKREVLKTLEPRSIQTCVTSPPYFGLRDYGHASQIGLEETPDDYVSSMVEVFRLVRNALSDEGTLWLNLGDSYAGSGKGQTSNGCADPKVKKTQGMKLPIHRPSSQSTSTLSGSKDSQINALRSSENVRSGLPAKNLIGIPWRVAFALQQDGWILRQDIIWAKPNPMPESVTDRCTKAHEYIFMFSKSPRYYYDQDATGFKDPKKFNGKHSDKQRGHSRRHAGFEEQCSGMRNKRSVWTVATKPYAEAHFATFPPDLIEPCILAGSPEGGIVLDPFNGSGTTGAVSLQWKRKYIGIELNPDYIALTEKRLREIQVEMFVPSMIIADAAE